VLHPDGSRLSPLYSMHVDDCLYADVLEFLPKSVSASAAGLFSILDFPGDPLVPVCLSEEKFLSFYTHIRGCLGRQYNSRTLMVGMLP